MDNPKTRQILEDVAAGQLDPAEAARLLEEMDDTAVPAPGDVLTKQPESSEQAAKPPMVPEIDRVLVRATSRRVRIVGDPTVATVAIDGAHTVRRDVSTLVVTGEAEMVPADDAFILLAGGRWREVADQLQHSLGRDLDLRVRVRPDLPVGVEVIAGSLHVENARALDHVRVTAGSVRVTGAEEPLDVLVQAGSSQIETRQVHGHSRLRCESGSMVVTLQDGSDVRVRSDVQLGRFVVQPEPRGRNRNRDLVVGTGAAEIDVEVVMGSVTVKTPQPEA